MRFLPKTDRIIVLEKGQVTETGTYQELMEKKAGFSKFVEEYASKKQNDDEESISTKNDCLKFNYLKEINTLYLENTALVKHE